MERKIENQREMWKRKEEITTKWILIIKLKIKRYSKSTYLVTSKSEKLKTSLLNETQISGFLKCHSRFFYSFSCLFCGSIISRLINQLRTWLLFFLFFDFFDTNFSLQIENKFFQSFEIDLSTPEKKTKLIKKNRIFLPFFNDCKSRPNGKLYM